MSTRKIKDAQDVNTNELIYFRGHALATFMSDGSTVEDAINNINITGGNGNGNINLSNYYTKTEVDNELNTKQDIISDLSTIRSNASKGATAVQPDTLSTVATSGSYNDLANKPTIPSAVTENTITNWGFTKNTGTVTGIKINGSSKSPSNGIVDLGTVITSHQDISGKQDKLVSGTNIKTINGTSILGSGDITIEGGTGNSDANVQAVDEISTIIDIDLDKYIVETTDDNITLDNNKYYKKTNVSSSISINLNMPEDNTVFTSFSIEFTTSESGTSVSLPDSIKWLNGELPTFENDFTYQISICNGLGVCSKYI